VNKRPVLLALFMILGIGIVLASQVLHSQGIEDTVQWVTNYDEGVASAHIEGSLVLIDVDVNSTLRNQYHVTSLPTVVVLTSSGVEMDRIGYVTAPEFLDFLTQILNQ
jgi:cytosine/uracil/thiamine/allantoin permease